MRDLPKSQLGVDIENDFEPKYITIRGKGKFIIDEIAGSTKKGNYVIFVKKFA